MLIERTHGLKNTYCITPRIQDFQKQKLICDDKEQIICFWEGRAQEEVESRDWKGTEETFGMMNTRIILIRVILSWVSKHVKASNCVL